MRQRVFLAVFAGLLSLLYLRVFVFSAEMEVELDSEKRNIFKVYWAQAGQEYGEGRMARVVVAAGHSTVRFRICDLAAGNTLRLDPAEGANTWVEVRSLTLRQPGFPVQRLAGAGALEQLLPLAGVAGQETTEAGIRYFLDSHDSQLQWRLPPLERNLSLATELARILCLWGLIFVLARYARPVSREAFAWVPYLMALVLALILAMAVISCNNGHPDEYVHLQAAQYYQDHWLPPEIGDPAIRHTYSRYGISRLNYPEVAYWLAGKYLAVVAPLQLQPHVALRGFNVLLWAALVLWVVARPGARLLALPLLLTPQAWYMFSYFNSEAFALVIALAIGWQVAHPESSFSRLASTRGPVLWRSVVLLSGLLGLLLLSKQNFYFFLVFVGLFLLWRLRYEGLGPWRLVWRRWATVALVGGMLFAMGQASFFMVNGLDRKAKLYQARIELAQRPYNPTTPLERRQLDLQRRDRGSSLRHLLEVDRWGEKMFRTSVGVYGYLTVSAQFAYYEVMRNLGLGLLALLTAAVVLYGGVEKITLWGLTCLAACALLAAALYSAWTIDFQAQGRYLLPILPMLGVCFSRLKALLVWPLFWVWMLALFFASVYNYIFVAFPGIIAFYGL
ncbi:MAG: hypothetical protein BWK76_15445 [Desulfobulbaceae bacterium A2]|nr:MAG: hypothetical protein BWK76_15445 [Desulfobulbaceae bacterium A2]